ncbi:MAG TPA: 4-carboxymuconolactone decarboxylase [Agrobacterium sp.]|uniref:carboxymuconolactone decarboxylase family protein n=1 Tax=Rhizobium sp. TaxID=391 RepID=UPI000E887F84|nr:4-carboxymuconolactone decarboxylase [Agrobacterium sp.]
MTEEKDIGREIRHKLFSAASEERWVSNTASRFAPELNQLTDDTLFGRVWSREGLPLKTRSLITITSLIVLDKPEQLKGHMMGGLRIGLTPEEIGEAILHLAFYAGWPAAYKAVEILGDVAAAYAAETKSGEV